jgi:hypothetical protein
LYVQTADLEYLEDRESACGLYGKAVKTLEPMSGSAVRPESKELLLRAKDRLDACRGRR